MRKPTNRTIVIAILIFFSACIDDINAQPINTRGQCLKYIRKHRPTCIRSVTPYEVCVCGKNEEDYQKNIRAESRPVLPPLDYSKCKEDKETGILYCPNSIFDN